MEFCYKGWIEYKKRMGLPLTTAHRMGTIIEGHSLRKCKHVIVTSTGIKNEIMKYYKVPERKITFIPNGVNINYFKPDSKKRKRLRKKSKLRSNDIIILFVGRALKRKGLEYLIRALHLIKGDNIKLVVCGGKDKYHDELVKKLGEKNRVVFAGDVKNIKDYYLISDIFVFPTFYEGFSFATLQAAACGLPIITTKANGTDDLVDNGKNGFLLDSRNPKKIAKKIKLLIKNKDLRKRMGRKARETAVKKFSWDLIARQILEVFEKTKGLYT